MKQRKKRQRKRKGSQPQGIGRILDALKESGELGKSFKEAAIWEHWPDIAGTHLMPYGRPLGIRDKTLVIEVVNAVWMHKFSYRKSEIVERVNEMFGPDLVEDLYFSLAVLERPDDPQDTV